MLAGWKPALPVSWRRLALDGRYLAAEAKVAGAQTSRAGEKLLAAGLFEELEMAGGFGIAFAGGGVEKDPGLIAVLRDALAETIKFGECDFGVGVAFFDGSPEQTSGFGLVIMGL